MKRMLLIIAICVLSMLNPICVRAAEGQRYIISDLGLSVEIPEKYMVIEKDELDSLGLSQEAGRYYLAALNEENDDYDILILVVMLELDDKGYSQLSDIELLGKKRYIEPFVGNNVTLGKFEVYHHGQTKFLKIFYEQKDNDTVGHNILYQTLNNNQMICFIMRQDNEQIDVLREMEFDKIIDGIQFDKIEECETDNSSSSVVDSGVAKTSAGSSSYRGTTNRKVQDSRNSFPTKLVSSAFIIGVVALIRRIFRKKDRWNPKEGSTFRIEAVISDVAVERLRNKLIKGTVRFSDGFEYIAYIDEPAATRHEANGANMDDSINIMIMQKATQKHYELWENANKQYH